MRIDEFSCGNIRIFIGDISELDITEIDISRLSKYRADKIKSISNEKNKRQSVGAEIVLNYGVKKCFGIDAPLNYDADARGKTYFTDIDAFFSLSHSGAYAVCALSDNAVGVDIQEYRPVNLRLAERFFTADEFAAVKENPIESFNRIWTRKEAVSKAVGDGLQIGFSDIDVMKDYITHNGILYRIFDVDINGAYSMAAAVMCP